MSLNRMFEMFERVREAAHWQAAFGEPQVAGDKTIIPVAKVGYAFGMGFGESAEPPEEGIDSPATDGGGGGGAASAKPLGALVVTPEDVYFEQIRDKGKIALVMLGVVAWSVLQVTKTLRAILSRS